jgi:hypothetical protein
MPWTDEPNPSWGKPKWDVIPVRQQTPGARMGGFWVVMQAYAVRNHWTVALLGPEGARITEGYGDWESVAIPRGRPITEWKGRKMFRQTIDLLYDGWLVHALRPRLQGRFTPGLPNLRQGVAYSRPGNPTPGGGVWIEGMLAELESLAMMQRGDDAPHRVRLYGAVWHPECSWAIQNLTWGDYVIDKVTGRKMRQQVTVELLEFNQPTELRTLPRGKAA